MGHILRPGLVCTNVLCEHTERPAYLTDLTLLSELIYKHPDASQVQVELSLASPRWLLHQRDLDPRPYILVGCMQAWQRRRHEGLEADQARSLRAQQVISHYDRVDGVSKQVYHRVPMEPCQAVKCLRAHAVVAGAVREASCPPPRPVHVSIIGDCEAFRGLKVSVDLSDDDSRGEGEVELPGNSERYKCRYDVFLGDNPLKERSVGVQGPVLMFPIKEYSLPALPLPQRSRVDFRAFLGSEFDCELVGCSQEGEHFLQHPIFSILTVNLLFVLVQKLQALHFCFQGGNIFNKNKGPGGGTLNDVAVLVKNVYDNLWRPRRVHQYPNIHFTPIQLLSILQALPAIACRS
eukprot:764818-Hanusia_phi.AAC.2